MSSQESGLLQCPPGGDVLDGAAADGAHMEFTQAMHLQVSDDVFADTLVPPQWQNANPNVEGVRAVSTAALLAVEKGRIDRLG